MFQHIRQKHHVESLLRQARHPVGRIQVHDSHSLAVGSCSFRCGGINFDSDYATTSLDQLPRHVSGRTPDLQDALPRTDPLQKKTVPVVRIQRLCVMVLVATTVPRISKRPGNSCWIFFTESFVQTIAPSRQNPVPASARSLARALSAKNRCVI